MNAHHAVPRPVCHIAPRTARHIAARRAKHVARTTSGLMPFVITSLCLGLGVALTLGSPAMAATGGETGTLPWDGPLAALTGFLTGSVAKYISIIAIFVAGLALIFGEELGQFAKRLLMIVIAIAFLVGASSFASTFIGSTAGAVL